MLLLLPLIACGGRQKGARGGRGQGTVVIATTADPDALFPPLSGNGQARQINEMIYDYLAQVGPELNTIGDAGFRPRLAERWTWSADSLALTFFVHPRARWHDGVPVHADDIAFTYRLYTNPRLASSTAGELGDIDSVTAPDSMRAIFWYSKRTSHQLLDATEMMILPRHLLGSIPIDSLKEVTSRQSPVGTGRFRFHSWTHGASVELRADTANYRGRPKIDRLIWTIAPDSRTAVSRVVGLDADVYDALHRENLAEVSAQKSLQVLTLPGFDYVFMAFNTRDPANAARPNPLFASRDLRRAITMGIDRAALVRNVFDTLAQVPVGPTVRAFPTTDPNLPQLTYDPVRAKALLDSLGWRVTGADGFRQRNGKDLAFTVLLPASSAPRVKMAVLLQEQLRQLGIRARTEQMEFSSFTARQQARDFDAILASWHLGATPSSLRAAWGSASAKEKGGINFGAYQNPVFDAYVDSAISARDLATSRRYYTKAYETIIQDAPAVWLYEPLAVIGLHRRLRPAELRADAWWFDLADWYIPAEERIARDTM